MKKIIEGKMYNTETAKEVFKWDNGNYGKFEYCEEALYKKKTGEFFLYGYGGPMSKYAISRGNETSSGEEINPLTEKEAKKWLEKKGDTKTYIETFGEVEE